MSVNRRALALSFVLLLWRSSTASVAEEVAFAVLSSTQVTHLERLCSRESPGRISSGWDPAFSQIALAEARLHSFVTANRRPSRPLGEYYRQYLGVVIDGRKLIYVNLFPRSLVERRELGGVLRDHWRTDFVDVCDGGDAFWGVLFDPAARRFFSPRFNGVA
jgi:hypothetical protein